MGEHDSQVLFPAAKVRRGSSIWLTLYTSFAPVACFRLARHCSRLLVWHELKDQVLRRCGTTGDVNPYSG